MLQNLDSLPDSSDLYQWVDFTELRAVVHPDKRFSIGDLDGVSHRNEHFDVASRWRDIMNFALTRQSVFGQAYPFKCTDNEIIFNFNATQCQRTYLGLLIAASLRLVAPTGRFAITRSFEAICYQVFSRLMPSGSEVHPTWAGAGEQARYQGALYDKMLLIASDLRCTANFVQHDFKAGDRGDGGLDIIAWHPMADKRDGMPIAFAQCGCSKEDWRYKQLEASPIKHSRHFPVMHPGANYFFLPLDFRRYDGDWANKSDIGQVIMVDRQRILGLSTQYNLFGDLPDMPFIDDAMAFSYQ